MSDILTERSARLLAGQKIATEYDIHVLLTDLVVRAGSQKAVAAHLGVSQAYLGDVLLGRRPISSQMAERMGWKKIEIFIQEKWTQRSSLVARALPKIGNKEKALIHVAKGELGLSDDAYRDVLKSVGVASSRDLDHLQFDELMHRFESCGFVSSKKTGPRRAKPAAGKEKLIGKINAVLADTGLPETYADGIAKKMFKIDRFIWCSPAQLWRVAAALSIYQKRKKKRTDSPTCQKAQVAEKSEP